MCPFSCCFFFGKCFLPLSFEDFCLFFKTFLKCVLFSTTVLLMACPWLPRDCQHMAGLTLSPQENLLMPWLFWAFPFMFSPGLTLPEEGWLTAAGRRATQKGWGHLSRGPARLGYDHLAPGVPEH